MADVTISQLSKGTPVGSNIIPYSTGNNTLGVPVSGIFQDTSSVGINTSVPNTTLDIRGTGIQVFNSIGFPNIGTVAIQGTGPQPTVGQPSGYHTCLDFKVSHTNAVGGRIALEGGFYGSTMKFGTSNLYGSNLNTAMVIDSSGNVGVGTTNPQTKLDINGTVTATAYRGGELIQYTPRLYFSGAPATVTYNTDRTGAYYFRIGKVVSVYGVIAITSKSLPSGQTNPFVTIEVPPGLPGGVTDFGGAGMGFPFSYIASGLTLPSTARLNGGVITIGTNDFRPYMSFTDGGSVRHINYDEISSNFQIQFSFSYICA